MGVKTRSRKRSPWRSSTSATRRASVMSEPIPMITTASRRARRADAGASARHRRAHLTDGLLQPDEDRLADEEMADIELADRLDGSDRFSGRIVEAVAGMDFQPESGALPGRRLEPGELGLGFPLVAGADEVAPCAGVQ